MRKSTRFLVYLSCNALLLALLFGHAFFKEGKATSAFEEKMQIVKEYGLSDLCLFTEASYTRHPAITDLHSPFQDGPMSFEHFPSGSILSAPEPRRRQ